MSAQNALRQFAYVAETTFGNTPVNPAMQLFAPNSYAADPTSETLDSGAITPHRQLTFSRRGNVGAEGSMTVELAHSKWDWVFENLFRNTFSANVLKPGNTQTSFTIEEGWTDANLYSVARGVRFNTMTLKATTDTLVTCDFGFMAADVAAVSGTPLDATPNAPVVGDSMFHEGGTITEGGSNAAFITAINFTVSNNMTGNYALGSSAYRSFSDGRFTVEGTVTAYFESAALFNKYRNSTTSSISATFTAGSDTLTFTLPNVTYTSGIRERGGDGPTLVTLGFKGVYSTSDAASIVITRST